MHGRAPTHPVLSESEPALASTTTAGSTELTAPAPVPLRAALRRDADESNPVPGRLRTVDIEVACEAVCAAIETVTMTEPAATMTVTVSEGTPSSLAKTAAIWEVTCAGEIAQERESDRIVWKSWGRCLRGVRSTRARVISEEVEGLGKRSEARSH